MSGLLLPNIIERAPVKWYHQYPSSNFRDDPHPVPISCQHMMHVGQNKHGTLWVIDAYSMLSSSISYWES